MHQESGFCENPMTTGRNVCFGDGWGVTLTWALARNALSRRHDMRTPLLVTMGDEHILHVQNTHLSITCALEKVTFQHKDMSIASQ